MSLRGPSKSQSGYTLVELIITVALGALLMSALTSVIFTATQGTNIAMSRVEASSQIRNFQQFAYDDFAQSNIWGLSGCTKASPCNSPISVGPVSYTWDQSTNFLDRATSQVTSHAATNVTAFSWYVDSNSTVVVSITVTVQDYRESQVFRFYPRLNP